MKALLTTAALFAAALFILDVPAANAATEWKSSQGSWNGNWSDSAHWTAGVPDSSDVVTFPTSGVGDYTVTMNANPGYAKTLDVHADARISISDQKRLEIGNADSQSSTISGDILLPYDESVLRFMYSHTLSDSGGYITGSHASAKIEIVDGKTLTSQITIDGMLQIYGLAGGSTTRFINGSGGLVRADDAGTLELNVDALDDGTNCSAGDWEVSGDSAAILQFTVGSTKLSGDFTVNVSHASGKLWIRDNVATEGDLIFSDGTILVDSECYFKAKQTGLCS